MSNDDELEAAIYEAFKLCRDLQLVQLLPLLSELSEINKLLPDPEPEVDALKRWLS